MKQNISLLANEKLHLTAALPVLEPLRIVHEPFELVLVDQAIAISISKSHSIVSFVVRKHAADEPKGLHHLMHGKVTITVDVMLSEDLLDLLSRESHPVWYTWHLLRNYQIFCVLQNVCAFFFFLVDRWCKVLWVFIGQSLHFFAWFFFFFKLYYFKYLDLFVKIIKFKYYKIVSISLLNIYFFFILFHSLKRPNISMKIL